MVRAIVQHRQRQQLCGTSPRAWPHDDPGRRLRDRHLWRPEHDPDYGHSSASTTCPLIPALAGIEHGRICNRWLTWVPAFARTSEDDYWSQLTG